MECKICKNLITEEEESVKLQETGKKGVNKASKEKVDDLKVEVGDVVHVDCRRIYIKKRKSKSTDEDTSCSTRSQNTFDFHEKCFLCGNSVTTKERKTKGCVTNVACKFKEVDKKVEAQIALRGDDPWAIAVNGRMQSINDLRAEDSIYHNNCYSNFCLGRPVPLKYAGDIPRPSSKRGRPFDIRMEEAYHQAIRFLLEKTREDEMVTLNDLKTVMDNSLDSCDESFSTKWIQARLLADYPDEIVVASVSGRENVITFSSTASKLLSDFHKKSKADGSESEEVSLIRTAAHIIKNEIKAKKCDLAIYPAFSLEELSTEYLTPLLDIFLQELITSTGNEVKRAAIGQSIMQGTRPRSLLCPVQVGLAVQLHNMFGSRILIDILHKLGFCISYTELLKFESCAAFHQNITLPPISETSVLHYAADNVDHNIRTLDGHNTFHGMGIIGIVTPGCFSPIDVPRRTVTNEEILSVGTIDFKILKLNSSKDLSFKFEKLKEHSFVDNTKLLGTLWQSAWILKPNQPQWNGFMQSVLDGSYPGKSTVHIMPMIDEKSSDFSCIYTTMMFIAQESRKYGKQPLLTFDQPLYWKAIEIQKHEKDSIVNDIVLILGSFHILMSFLGSIGHLMTGTGLQPLLEQVYAENTVPHILSGKAVSRARRAHLLAICALEGLKISEMYDIDLSSRENEEDFEISERFMKDIELKDLGNLLEKSLNREVGVNELTEVDTFRRLLLKQEDFLQAHKNSKTSQLWLMYMDMVEIMCTFIKAERTGNFLLHQQSIKSMLPYFAASGHFYYTKSAYCYLQQMQDLQLRNPEVYQCFIDGFNVVRRTDKFYAGIGTDLMIEQELMRSVKTTGGLTHGRGMTELQRTKWLLSTTTTAAVKQAMEEFAGVRYESSEQHVDQHKECSKTRYLRDYQDAMKMLQYLEFRNPFEGHANIVCIDTGEEGDASVNVHLSKDIGQKVIDSMVGKSILNISFSKKSMAITMKPRTSVLIEGEVVPVDPQLLFQRLLLTVGRDEGQLKSALEYELCSHPASIVGNDGLMRKADKPDLADEIWKVADQDAKLPSNPTYVIDGGNLLFKLKWKKGSTFENIFQSYENYVLKHYGPNTVIVFDGYPEEPSTKDTTHLRRKSTKTGRFVNITPHMKLNVKKDLFLSVLKNKNLFNQMLKDYINTRSSGIQAIQENGDADYLLAQTAITKSKDNQVVVISADTDILILLIHGADSLTRKNIFLTSESITGVNSLPKVWDINQIRSSLGKDVCENILAVHAFLGCDTVSRIHGFGKGAGLKKFVNDEQFRSYLSLFSNESSSQDEIAVAGEHVLSILYGEPRTANLNDLRYTVFCKKITTRTKAVLPESLPPTAEAARYHSLRVYHQVQTWKGVNLHAEEWGWMRRGKFLLPKLMGQSAAPPNLMKLIRCNCKTGCGSHSNCSCQKHNFKCTPMCGTCKGVSCFNHQECDETVA